jgi:hypothetical protein
MPNGQALPLVVLLPRCRWRGGPTAGGRWGCSSPKLVAPRGVTAELCGRCPYRDHETLPSGTAPAEPLAGVKGPSLIRKAGNFVRDGVRHALDRMRKVSPETKARRLESCKGCPHNRRGVCNHGSCGCNLEWATWWASKACPIGKWEAE